MVQIYFLSVLLNIIGGFGLASDLIVNKLNKLNYFSEFFNGRTKSKIIIGILSVIVGILKLLSSMDVVVAGDLLPALCNIAVGIALTLDYYKDRSDVDVASDEKVENFFSRYSSLLGVIAVIFGLLHFILPKVLLL